MGFGFAICRTIVEDHGGKLRLAKSDSRGLIFDVSLPVGDRASASYRFALMRESLLVAILLGAST